MASTFDDTLAVGDGANDLAMIQHAGLGVAYHAKPVVAAAAGAAIQHNDLTALLYLQGYNDARLCGRDILFLPYGGVSAHSDTGGRYAGDD